MNKRQRKKREKKYLPVIADEFNLMTMTQEELKQAMKDYLKFREKYAFCKHYRDLKNAKKNHKFYIQYFYPTGKQFNDYMQKVASISCSRRGKPIIVKQSVEDFSVKNTLKKQGD